MAERGQVRIRIPSGIRRGDVVRVRCLVIHPMERVDRAKDGKAIDRNCRFINRVAVTCLGKRLVEAETTQSVSENPFFSFAVKATDPGQLKVTFTDTAGGRYEGTADIKFS